MIEVDNVSSDLLRVNDRGDSLADTSLETTKSGCVILHSDARSTACARTSPSAYRGSCTACSLKALSNRIHGRSGWIVRTDASGPDGRMQCAEALDKSWKALSKTADRDRGCVHLPLD